MTSDSIFVGAVALITLGGVFFYLLRVEALAKKLESQLRDEDLDAPQMPPLANAFENGASSRDATRSS